MFTHRVHVLMLAFFTKTFWHKRALFDGVTPTLVIRPNGADKWVSLVAAVAGAEVRDVDRQGVCGSAAEDG